MTVNSICTGQAGFVVHQKDNIHPLVCTSEDVITIHFVKICIPWMFTFNNSITSLKTRKNLHIVTRCLHLPRSHRVIYYESYHIFYSQRWIGKDGVECSVCVLCELYTRKEGYGAGFRRAGIQSLQYEIEGT